MTQHTDSDVEDSSVSSKIWLGHITGVSGLKGWVKVHSDTSPRENIVTYTSWWLEHRGQWQRVSVLSGRPQGKTIVAQLDGIETPEQASGLIGARIAIERSELPPPADGEYYWADLIGMQVVMMNNTVIGPVDRLFETGANDVLVVRDERDSVAVEDGKASGKKEILVPWLVPDVIVNIDPEQQRIQIDWDPDF